jgi:hypothetical protein
MFELVLEERHSAVALLTRNRPNALNAAMVLTAGTAFKRASFYGLFATKDQTEGQINDQTDGMVAFKNRRAAFR